MNQHLQNIMSFLNLDKTLSEEEKNTLTISLDSANKELELTAFKLDQTEKVKRTTAILLEETIEELEQKQKEIIAKNRELEIEASLEKVRSRTSAMQKSEELGDVAEILFKQIKELGIHPWTAGFNIWLEGNEKYIDWITDPSGGFVEPYTVDLTLHPGFRQISDAKKSGEDFKVFEISGTELVETYELLTSFAPKQFAKMKAIAGNSFPARQFNHYFFGAQVGLMFITPEPHPEDWDIFKRFGKVFEQTYTRFLDLQKAEESAREGEIELALERVRARTMGMQHSSQLREIAATTLEQLQSLGFMYGACSIVIMNAVTGNMTWWISGFGNDYPTCYENYYFEHPFYLEQLNNWKEGKKYAVMVCEGEAKKMYDKYIFSETEFVKIPVALQKIMQSFEKITFSNAYMRHGALSWSTEPLSDDDASILQRFASVFEQSYTRFLDLQKAEGQAREAEIELALERVRARTMAMQHSSELSETATLLFKQVLDLGINAFVSAFHIWDTDDISTVCWASGDAGGIQPPIRIPHTVEPFHKQIYEARLRGDYFFMMETEGNDLVDAYRFLFSLYDGRKVLENIEDAGFPIPKYQATHCAFFLQGYIMFNTYQPVPEAYEIFKRFGKVFEQTYTRFLDLQKAEALAKEAIIETALEKIRSRSLAMHQSVELKQVMAVMFEKMTDLSVLLGTIAIQIFDEKTKSCDFWLGNNLQNPALVKLPFDERIMKEDNYMLECWEAKKSGIDIINKVDTPEKITLYFNYVFANNDESVIPLSVRDFLRRAKQHAYCLIIEEHSSLFVDSWDGRLFDEEKINILKRVAKVFNQAYIRFLDLKKSEEQTKEAQIELGLERVRAKAMSMQQSHELAGLVETVFKELTKLNILFDRCIIMIYDQQTNDSTWWLANPERESEPVGAFVKYHEYLPYKAYLNAWKSQLKQWNYLLEGEEKKEWDTFIFSETDLSFLPQSVINGMQSVDRVYLNASFNNFGSLTVSSLEQLSDSNFDILLRFAKVFDLTYTRFNDLQKSEAQAERAEQDLILLKAEKKRTEEALNELQITQKQLIEAEKMASLGELTAGIAHEIQNPLNFVNNFSEVSTELVDEMNEEILKGNLKDAQQIAADLKENLAKINHHGKRAGDIVRGMLQHSRSSSGQKEPTDINALADEYLRLAYHGLRAKDKLFNATIHTDFDESIGKANIIPQDIGRVFLNLITNAFYVVDEKKKSGIENYEPSVSVSTKKVDGKILISVKDNGNGIPSKVIDKIFQPFFTTKPTGQGTGLGLSLSYDIVKAHGGEIKVKTKVYEGLPDEGSGTEFTIQLPI